MTPIPSNKNAGTSENLPAISNKTPITMSAAEKAAREAGFDIIDAKKLKAAGLFGEFVSQVGAIHLGRSRLALNIARADRAMDFCEEAARSSADAEVMMGLMKINADLIGKSNNAAELLIKSAQQAAETAKAEAMVALPGFAPRMAVGNPTQVNVTVNAKSAETKVEEDDSAFPEDAG